MNNKWKLTTLSVAGLALVLSPTLSSVVSAETVQTTDKSIFYSQDNDLYDKQLKEATELYKQAKESKSKEDIQTAIDTAFNLPLANGYKYDDRNNLLSKLATLITAIDDKNKDLTYSFYFIEASIERAKTTLIDSEYRNAYSTVYSLPDSKAKTAYMKQLKEINKALGNTLFDDLNDLGEPPYSFDWDKLPSDAFEDYNPPDTGNYLPGYPSTSTGNKVDKPNPNGLPENSYSEKYLYETIGANCFKVTTRTYTNNKTVTTKDLVTGNQAFCDIAVVTTNPNSKPYDLNTKYDFSKVSPAPAGSGSNINGGIPSSKVNSYMTDSKGNSLSDIKNASSGITLQFTLDKTAENIEYYDTNLEVSKLGTITFETQKEALAQLTIKSGGKIVEDINRVLFLIENKIIVIENNGNDIPTSIFKLLLKDFKVDMVAMKAQTSDEKETVKE